MSDQTEDEELDQDEPAEDTAEGEEPSRLDLAQVWRVLRVVVPALWAGAVVVAAVFSGIELAFLVVAAGVLSLVITLMWSSVQSLTGSSSIGFEEALGMGAPSKVEEQKRAVLRALKDLEYERSVGKISTEDYAELSARYRAEAKRLIQSVDEALGPARASVERSLRERLDRAGLNGDEAPANTEAEAEPQGAAPAEAKPSEASESPSEPEGVVDPAEAPSQVKPAPEAKS